MGSKGRVIDEQDPVWTRYALGVIAVATVVHWVLLAQGFAPLHFDESQYWTYGQDLDWGYYSKPPMIAWLIRLSTEIFGNTAFGVRAFAPLLHAWIAWMIFLSGARLFDRRTGFWAALGYATMPGVAVSAGLMTTDPAMMAAWATALYGLIRAIEAGPAAPGPDSDASVWLWWALVGVAIGLGLLSKYTMIAFVGGAIGYALFSRQGSWGHRPTDRTGAIIALVAALIVFSPNLIWNAGHDFASFSHVADNAKMGDGPDLNPGKGFEFFFVQAAIIGPILFGALLWMVAVMKRWRAEWQYRLLMWLTLPLPIVITVVAFLSRAHPNWAAPAYVAGVIAVAAWLLDRNLRGLLIASAAIGVIAFLGFAGLGGYYAGDRHASLPRLYDPYKKMRDNPPICAKALALAEGAKLVSTDRKLLADCMFMGGLGFDDIRIWAAGKPGNHYQLAAPLEKSDNEQMLFLIRAPRSVAETYLLAFREATILEEGRIATHADREERFTLARVKGFLGY